MESHILTDTGIGTGQRAQRPTYICGPVVVMLVCWDIGILEYLYWNIGLWAFVSSGGELVIYVNFIMTRPTNLTNITFRFHKLSHDFSNHLTMSFESIVRDNFKVKRPNRLVDSTLKHCMKILYVL